MKIKSNICYIMYLHILNKMAANITSLNIYYYLKKAVHTFIKMTLKYQNIFLNANYISLTVLTLLLINNGLWLFVYSLAYLLNTAFAKVINPSFEYSKGNFHVHSLSSYLARIFRNT